MSFETDTQSTGFENPFSAHGRAPGTPSPIARRTAEIDQQQLHQPDSQESPHERGEVDVSQEEEGTGFGSSRALTQKSHTAHTQSIRSGFHTSTTQSHSQRKLQVDNVAQLKRKTERQQTQITELKEEIVQLKRVASRQSSVLRNLEDMLNSEKPLQSEKQKHTIGKYTRSEYNCLTGEALYDMRLDERPVFKWFCEGIRATKVVRYLILFHSICDRMPQEVILHALYTMQVKWGPPRERLVWLDIHHCENPKVRWQQISPMDPYSKDAYRARSLPITEIDNIIRGMGTTKLLEKGKNDESTRYLSFVSFHSALGKKECSLDLRLNSVAERDYLYYGIRKIFASFTKAIKMAQSGSSRADIIPTIEQMVDGDDEE